MAATTADRLVHVLEQYTERLHQQGDEGHDEELNYIKQILASPIFYDIVRDSSQFSQEQTSIFSEVASDLISGIQESTDDQLTPTEKHKQKLQRKQSLKALRNVVTPKNSPRITTKRAHGSNAGDGKKGTYDGASASSPSTSRSMGVASSGGKYQNSSHSVTSVANGKRVQDTTPLSSRTLDHSYTPSSLSNGGIQFEAPPTSTPDGLAFESPSRNLSNSTGTLIERSLSPSSDGNKQSTENLLMNGGTLLTTNDTPYMIGNGTGPGSIPPVGMEWDHPSSTQQLLPSSIHDSSGPPLGLKLKLPSVANRQPPSYQRHMQTQQVHTSHPNHNVPPHHRIVTSPQVEGTGRPPPPPYGQNGPTGGSAVNLQSQGRSKSFDRLLESSPSDGSLPIHFPPPNRQTSPQKDINIADSAHFGPAATSSQYGNADSAHFAGTAASPSQYGNPIVRPMTDGVATKNHPTTVERRRTTLTVRLEKGEKGLGFQVKGLKHEQYGDLFVQHLQPGGVAKRDGQLRVDDQITHINGRPLKDLPHSEGVKLLQSTRGMVELIVMRDVSPAYPAPPLTGTSSLHHKLSPDPPNVVHSLSAHPSFSDKSENVDGARTSLAREGGDSDDDSAHQKKILSIELPNEGHGFGFGVVSTDEDLTVIHSIVPGGIAEKDGRLLQGDQLLQINEESVIHMHSDDVIAKLRSVGVAGYPVKLVVARKVREDGTDDVDINDVHSSDDEIEEFEVEILKKSGGGLGITIAGLVKTDTGEEVMGIYVTSMNPVGAAASDGRVRVGDRILKVDGHSLRGLENMEAASVLRNSGNPVKMVLCRKRGENGTDNDKGPTAEPVAFPSSSEVRSEGDGRSVVARGEPGDGGGESDPEDEDGIMDDLVKEWSNRLGPNYIVKVDQVMKVDGSGLGIRMESTAELDDQGQPHMDSLHHVIRYVNPAGPIGRHGILREGDEIIMVNGRVLVGLPHDEATKVVLNTPNFVTIVVCRMVGGEGREPDRAESHHPESTATTTEGPHSSFTSSSEGERRLRVPEVLPAIDFTEFSRRFERQSWRERHEEERKRLKERFEQRRKEHEHHIRQQEEELLQKEMEFKERQRRQTEEEERRKIATAKQRSLSDNLQYDYNYSGYMEYERQVQSPDSMQESDSSGSVLSPVPGSTMWESDLHEIDLLKEEGGLGFSILDFADPLNPGDRVILIHSLVDRGTAERDGRLKVGDKLLSVNHVSVVNHSLQFAVQQLVDVPMGGIAKIGVCHPLSVSPDLNSDPSSPLTERDSVNSAGEHEGEDEDEDGSVDNGASLELDDEGKPVLDLALPEQDGETFALDSAEDGEDVKKKKPSETDDDDDEPPPPYSKNDPVEDDKSDNEGGDPSAQQDAAAGSGAGGTTSEVGGVSNEGETREQGEERRENAEVANRLVDHPRLDVPRESFGFVVQDHEGTTAQSRSHSSENILTSENDTDASRPSSQAQRSPASMSRISSPERGRTLSELTRITPEDESRLGSHSTSSTSNLPLPAHEDHVEVVYSSDTTLVNSESQPSQTEVSHESSVSSIVADTSGTPKAHQKKEKRRPKFRGKKDKSRSSSEHKPKVNKKDLEDKKRRHRLPSPHQKDSPTSYQHNLTVCQSQQTFTSSQDSNFDIGLSPECESGEHSSEIDTEPREIRIRKEGNSNIGLSLAYDEKSNCIVVKSVSSSGVIAKDGRIRVGDRIDWINGKSMIGVHSTKARQILKRASKMDELVIVYVPAVQTYIPTSTSSYGSRQISLNESQGSLLSIGSEGGGGGGGQPPSQPGRYHQDEIMTSQAGGALPHPPGMRVVMAPPQLVQPTPQWPSTEMYHMQPRPYYDKPMGKPPPPYGYQQGIAYPPSITAQPTPPTIQWPQPDPANYGMGVSVIQAPPGMLQPHWGIPSRPPPPHPPMMAPHRDPPQYSDLITASVQQTQMMQGHAPQYPNIMTTSSGAHMTSMHSGSGQTGVTRSGSGHSAHQAQQMPTKLMIKSQSESQFQSGGQRSHPERRHNSQGTSDVGAHFQGGGAYHQQSRAEQVRRHSSKQKQPSQQRCQDLYDDRYRQGLSQDAGTVNRSSSGGGGAGGEGFANRKARSQPNISHGSAGGGGGGGSVHERERGRHTRHPRTATLQESPDHSHHNSWAINDEEDPALRDEFPDVDGHLFEVWLRKGKSGGLGLSIVANTASTSSQPVRGIVIMGIQRGGAAEQSGEIKWGDMILKVNDTCVIGMSQNQVQELLATAQPNVRFVLLRQYSNGGAAKQQHTTTGSGISLDGLPQVQAVTLFCRDKRKGFGFTIDRLEEGSESYYVVVASIAKGGVADISGQLNVGDKILSVDGTKTLGYAMEKARNLIQQAKSRGQVTLMVATRGTLSQAEWSGEKAAAGGGGGDGRNMLKEIPDGVVLRQKKKSSLKSSSRRRPVSVDYELNSNSWENDIDDPSDGFTVSGAMGGGVLKETTNRSSHYSNRNSHPLTEREMEQGLQSLEGQKDIIPFKECEVIIFKGHQVLGLIIAGGTDSLLDGVYIQKIIPGSPADKDGRLKPGDKVLRIDNSSMEGVSRDEALRALQRSPSFVRLTVVRDPHNAPTMPSYKEEAESTSPIGNGGDIETVELMKPEQGGLGLLICESDDQPGVFIQEVVQNKAAYLDGRIRPGDRILAINGEKIYNAGQNYVVRLLQTCRARVTLTVCHPPSPFSSPAREFQRSVDLESAHPAFPPPDYPYGGVKSNSRIPFQSPQKGTGNNFIVAPPTSYQTYAGGSYGADQDIDLPSPGQDEPVERKIKIIRLHRGPRGLGISIVGGMGSIHGDLPIYIKQVFNEGAAGQDGRLKKGDQLLSVNGVSFENVTHKFAADTLKYLQGDVTLEVVSNS